MSETNRPDTNQIAFAQKMFNSAISFNAVCGFEIDLADYLRPCVHFDMRDELIGNFRRGNLHGGVISSVLDVTGGLLAFIDIAGRLKDRSEQHMLERFERMGTIDLRIDYLRPGLGNRFTASGAILRSGRKVTVTRMELHNNDNTLIAVGTGAYVVS